MVWERLTSFLSLLAVRILPHAGDDGVDGDQDAKSDGEDGLYSNKYNPCNRLG